MKILVAEDDPYLKEYIQLIMDDWGYNAEIASNGLEVYQMACKNQYDLCLMDINMPIMNGWEATSKIRRATRYFPIMALTGNPNYDKKLCLESGMDDFLRKPYTPDKLHSKINELTVKSEELEIRNDKIYIKREMPMDKQHAQEIKKLKEQGLVKVKFGTNGEELILHKNTTNKISHDFILKENKISVFLNHHPDKPTRCELYKEHCHITQTYLSNGDYDIDADDEKEEMKEYTTRALKPENEQSTG